MIIQCKAPFAACTYAGTLQDIRQHTRDAHNFEVYPCYKCESKVFWSKQELSIHYRDYHYGDFSCVFCPARFKTHSTCRHHILTFHRALLGFIEKNEKHGSSAPKTINLLDTAKEFGLPVDSNQNFRVERNEYIVEHDKEKFLWGFQVLTKEKIDKNVIISTQKLRSLLPDPALPHLKLTPWGITRAKLVNGHVVPAANNRHTNEAFKQCMFMGNIVPQHKMFNNGINQTIEAHTRKLTRYWPRVDSCILAIYGPKHLKKWTINGVLMHVADSFATIIRLVRPDIPQKLVQVFNIPNRKRFPRASLFSYRSTLEEIQNLTGHNVLSDGYQCTWDWGRENVLYSCPERTCWKLFTNKSLQEKHSREHENKFRCPVSSCQKLHETEEARDNHISFRHTKYECEICQKIFYDSFKYKSHMRVHMEDPPPYIKQWKCEICKQMFTRKTYLKKHQLLHTGEKPYTCSTCHRTFRQRSALNTHMRVHTGEKPYQCDVCGKAFITKQNLSNHMLIHTGEKPFNCTYCSSKFREQGALNGHIRRVHNCEPHLKRKLHHPSSPPSSLSSTAPLNQPQQTQQLIPTPHKTRPARKYKCEICGKKFLRQSNLIYHKHTHSNVRRHACPTCGKKFKTSSTLKIHMRFHDKEKLYLCEICGKEYNTKANLTSHRLIHTDNDEKKPFNCHICSKSFREPTALNRHIKRIHSCEQPHEPKGTTTTTSLSLVPLTDQPQRIQQQQVQDETQKPGKKYKCQTCGDQFFRQSELTSHKRTHIDKIPNVCSTCGKKFKTSKTLKIHMRLHADKKPNPCGICGKGFNTAAYLASHMLIHTGEKPFRCSICSKSFREKSSLKKHTNRIHDSHPEHKSKQNVPKNMMITTTSPPSTSNPSSSSSSTSTSIPSLDKLEEKPFVCDKCGSRFKIKKSLKLHKRAHTGEKPYRCETCGKCFNQSSHLTTHKRTHTGEKPYVCVTCGKRFSQSMHLTSHKRIHTGERPFSCTICTKKFIEKGALDKHMKGVHKEEKTRKKNNNALSAPPATETPAQDAKPGTPTVKHKNTRPTWPRKLNSLTTFQQQIAKLFTSPKPSPIFTSTTMKPQNTFTNKTTNKKPIKLPFFDHDESDAEDSDFK